MKESYEKLDDQLLITGYLAGDSGCFDMLYERYKRKLYGFLYRLTNGRKEMADEIFQKCWIKAIAKMAEFKNTGSFQAWLCRIAHNLAMDDYRKHSKKIIPLSDAESFAMEMPTKRQHSPAYELGISELRQHLDAAMTQLSPEIREVFLLRRQGLSFRDIAAVQQCPVNTALGRMHYAVSKLKILLADWQ